MSAPESTIIPSHPPQNGLTPSTDEALFDEPISEDGLYVSEAQYWADYYQSKEFTYEWNNGRLEQKPMTDYAQFLLFSWFFGLLKDFLHVNPMARMTGLELGFRMALARKTVARIPDLGIVCNDNVVPLLDKDRSYKGIFDICIESLSDSKQTHIDRDVIDKKNEYAEAGVREYYILDERGKETQFYRLDASGIYRPIRSEDGVIRSTVLPGFQFRYADLYRLPQPPTMLDDAVYQDFTSPFVRAERVISEEQRQRAEQERQRAAKADDRAARYAAMLRELGIDPDA
jgi:Uma2 family endonuclease